MTRMASFYCGKTRRTEIQCNAVLPGVTIGEGCVIGAGSVVSRSIPAGSLAFGNPCRVVGKITEKDRISEHPELFE